MTRELESSKEQALELEEALTETTTVGNDKEDSRRQMTRRSFLIKSGGVLGGLTLGMYLKPSLTTLNVPRVYASITEPPGGATGCTPGFWKQSQHFSDWPSGFDPDDLLTAHFSNVPGTLSGDSLLIALRDYPDGVTRMDRLKASQLLLKQGVAGLLNEAKFPGAYGQPDVAANVSAALATGDVDTMLALKDLLDAANNAGCDV